MKKINLILSVCVVSLIFSGCDKNSSGSEKQVTDVTTAVTKAETDTQQEILDRLIDEIGEIKEPYYNKDRIVKGEYQEKVTKEIKNKLQEYVDKGLIKEYSETDGTVDIIGNDGASRMCYYSYDENSVD